MPRHTNDASTLALYRFDEASATVAADETGNCSVDTATGTQSVVAGAYGNGRRFNGDGSLSAPTSAALRTSLSARGGWSLEGDLYIAAADWRDWATSYEVLFAVGDPNTDAWLFSLAAAEVTGVKSFWIGNSARGYGQATPTSGTGDAIPVPADIYVHVAIVAEFLGGTSYRYRLELNGIIVGYTGTSTTAPPAATSAMRIYFGDGDSFTSGKFQGRCRWDDVRISSTERTAAEIATSATNVGLDSTAPAISNVSPTAGSTITRNQAWAFRVTDDTAFRRIVVIATLNDSDGTEVAKEVVYDGSAFSAAYSGTKTTIVSGTTYDFSIQRVGGWPYAPTFDVFAIDTSGNEGT